MSLLRYRTSWQQWFRKTLKNRGGNPWRRLIGVAALLLLPAAAFGALPAGWSDLDVGAPGRIGSASYLNGNWTLAGGGADIWGASDQFHFAYHPVTNDQVLIALVSLVQNTDPWSKAGVMFRESTNANSRQADVVATSGNGVSFQWRLTAGGASSSVTIAGLATPVWVGLARSNNVFRAYYSRDGVMWVAIGSAQTVNISSNALGGLAVTAHNNASLCTAVATMKVESPTFGVFRDLWTGLPAGATTLSVLTNPVTNPNWPNKPNLIYSHFYPALETETISGVTNYGQRLRGFIVPPTDGEYTFWIAGNHSAELSLSTDETPGHKSAIARVVSGTTSRNWATESGQRSTGLTLQAGRRYYLEALSQLSTGADNLAVRWHLPSGGFEEPIAATNAGGALLIPFTGVDSPPGLYLSPTNISVFESLNAKFTALVTNQSSLNYQWVRDGATLPGATNGVLVVSNLDLAANNGQVYSCVISNACGSITSPPALLRVLPDTRPLLGVNAFSLGLDRVQVNFSKLVDPASATNIANYTSPNALTILGATLVDDGSSVILSTLPLVYGERYDLVINAVSDRASVPNVIAPGTVLTFRASPYVQHDIGVVSPPSSFASLSNGVVLTGSGADLGGTNDSCSFAYERRSGDFDVRVRMAGLGLSDVWAKAGLMAREDFTAPSRFVAALATPAMNGTFFASRELYGAAASSFGNFPANYPNTWLRLKRQGNVFTGFAGYDGTAWTLLGSVTIPMAADLYLGVAVSSHSGQGAATTAEFRDVGDVGSGATLGGMSNPHEAPGPSSRKTGLVISEIMYAPAPRDDGRNVQFVELYNSNPFFHDISGYHLTGDNLDFVFPPGTMIRGGAYVVVAAVPENITAVYGVSNLFGPFSGSLNKSDTLKLRDEHGAILLTVPYSNKSPWPVAAAGAGPSLVLGWPTYGEGDPRAWDISDTVGGSPGAAEPFTPSPLREVRINELLVHSQSAEVSQYVELYNHSLLTNDLSGCILTDDPTIPKFTVPPGTVVPPGGFTVFPHTQLGFAFNPAGGIAYLLNPDGSRVLDALAFDGQADGLSIGRWPDGGREIYPLASRTPGQPNGAIWVGDVVINELMYDPLSGNDDDQFIELYNQGTNTISLAGWKFAAGVTFTFPEDTVLRPDDYLVVARNWTNLLAKYPNLSVTNTFGNFSGKLSHSGERVALARPQVVNGNDTAFVVVDEVTYGTGGRWGHWSAGGGSSLELIDPRANHRLGPNWADSDDTQKSSWTTIEATGVLDNGRSYGATYDAAQLGLLDDGECLVDDVEVLLGTDAPNFVLNPGFEEGLNNWMLQGCFVRSSLESPGYGGTGNALHVRATSQFWTGANSCQVYLAANQLAFGATATLRFKARWLHGWPEAILRLHGNWMEATGMLPVPANLGTPGLPNSQRTSNAGPAIVDVTHFPVVPPAGQNVVVTARVHDPDGLQNLMLRYRLDPANDYTDVPMTDDAQGGDAIAGDGIYSATIPGQAANVVVAFVVVAADLKGAATRFPALQKVNAPDRECVILFGDANPTSSFGTYHLWVTRTNLDRWLALPLLSNESMDATFACGNRVIYNAEARFSGSPYKQAVYDSPIGKLCSYKWDFPDDDRFLGVTSFNKIHNTGNAGTDDPTLQREQTANGLLRALGEPWLYKRYIAVYVNGNRRNVLMEDTQCPDNDVVEEQFPEDSNGWLYKMQPWFEFAATPSGNTYSFVNASWCTLMPYTTTGGAKKPARYRYNYLVRHTPDTANAFTNVFALIDAANSSSTSNYVANLESMADMENWMRVFAANHAAGNDDSFGALNGQNLYGYLGAKGTKYTLLMWDFNAVMGNVSAWLPGANLFTVNAQDSNLVRIFNEPTFRRMYWRGLQELIDGALNPTNAAALQTDKYRSFLSEGLAVEDPATKVQVWMSQACTSIRSQLAAVNATNFTVIPSIMVSNNLASVSGVAPVAVKSIRLNGVVWPVTWTTLTNWTTQVPLQFGTNFLVVEGVDLRGAAVPGTSNLLVAAYSGQSLSPAGQVVINEIMYHPVATNAQFVELFNTATNQAFDLSGWRVDGLGYSFPAGALIPPGGFLVLAGSRSGFAAAYGATIPVFDTFPTPLPDAGGTLALVQPSQPDSESEDLVVAKVRYENRPPWPLLAATGSSLQLMDAAQANWRVGNWAAASGAAAFTPGSPNSLRATLPPFPEVWINELQTTNLDGITTSEGQYSPWVELASRGTEAISLDGLYLGTDLANLTAWAFPTNAAMAAGSYLVVFADGLTNLDTAGELHAALDLHGSAGAIYLSRLVHGVPRVVDYVNYSYLAANHSYGSFPDAQSFDRREFFFSTPGAANNPANATVTVAINEWMAANVHTIQDPLDKNRFDDWLELYNYGANPADLSGCFLSDTLADPFQFQIPPGFAIPAHGRLLVWADGKAPAQDGDLHVNFKMSGAGEALVLSDPQGNLVDYVEYGPQSDDVSQGRFPDGDLSVYTLLHPTPRGANFWTNSPPALGPINNQMLILGQTLTLTPDASDPDAPLQTISFSLGTNAPAGAYIDPGTGQFTWLPVTAPATNNIVIIATDSAIPSLSVSQSFSVVVLPPPALTGSAAANGDLHLGWNSVVSRIYQVEYTESIASGSWVPFGAPISGNGLPINLAISPKSFAPELPAVWFRLRILP